MHNETQEQCTLSADWDKNFCTHHAASRLQSPSMRPDLKFKSDRAFLSKTDKLTPQQRTAVMNLGNKPKKIIPKLTKNFVDQEEPAKEHVHLHDLMLPREVAEYLSLSPMTIKRWSNKGILKCIVINSRGDRRYLRSEINKLLGGEV